LVVHKIDPSSIKLLGNKVQAKLLFANDPKVKPLLLELGFFLSEVDGKCGIVRTYITEQEPLHPRFRLTPGDVVRKEDELLPDKVSVSEGSGSTEISSSSGSCKVTLRHSPFEVEFAMDGQVLQKLNSRRFFNFERYRPKGSHEHAGLVDATDLDSNNLFEENFGGHMDSKPRGPAAVGIDVAFEAAVDVFGLAEHAVGLGLGANVLSEPYRFFNLDVFEYALDVPMALYGAIPLVTAIHHLKSGDAIASGKKYFTWHPSHFAQPDKLLSALEASKRKLVTIIDPHIKKDNGYDVYNKMKNHDFFTKTKDKQLYDGWCWPGTSSYPDFCNPEARRLWTTFFKMDYYPHNRPDLYTWNDMNEPSVFNGPEVTMPRDNLHKCSENDYKVEHRDVHNVYGFYHHMATVEGQLVRAPNVRPFVLTRSFFAGSHKHGAIWTGDNMAKWEHLAISVPMLVSLCLCGTSFVGADVPGFFFDPEPELFRRWHQLGIWYPFYRGHAHLETKRREPWMLGEEITQNVREQVTVRYQMLPTWYTLFAEWALSGKPILRPLWYEDAKDPEAFRHQNTHFLLGSDVLVRAITKPREEALDVYLPSGSWFDFWDAEAKPLAGGRSYSIKADPAHVPVYVRAGAILPKKMRRRRSSLTMASDPYTIMVYGNQAGGHVYMDDGQSHDFQQGHFVYDKLSFDGQVLASEPSQRLHVVGSAKGVGGATSKGSTAVERLVFVGLPSSPASAYLEGTDAKFEVTSSRMQSGAWVATVKKPHCQLGAPWKLRLTF
ncbi:unnamed protein product, partial [Symbiodinium pilosum]